MKGDKNLKPIGIYIHIPFCQKKCYYCDFVSYDGKNEFIGQYIDCLLEEISLYKDYISNYKVETIFLGGGTPSILGGKQLSCIIDTLVQHYNTYDRVEITMEVNPGLLNREKLFSYYSSGVNRLSFGLQACQNHLLKSIGRIHKYEDFVANLKDAREVGFENINADLIFGLPNQTIVDWQNSLKKVVELELAHLSTYSLII